MPQIGQLPGPSRTISGCIGHVYSTRTANGSTASSAIPHFGQLPIFSDTTSECIGHVNSLRPAVTSTLLVVETDGAFPFVPPPQHPAPSAALVPPIMTRPPGAASGVDPSYFAGSDSN